MPIHLRDFVDTKLGVNHAGWNAFKEDLPRHWDCKKFLAAARSQPAELFELDPRQSQNSQNTSCRIL